MVITVGKPGRSGCYADRSTRRRLSIVASLVALSVACSAGAPPGAPAGGGVVGGAGGTGGVVGGAGGSGGSTVHCSSIKGATLDMVAIPAGSFFMGCNTAVDNDCSSDERPGREVRLHAFQIARTEVTQDQYAACIQAGHCSPPACDWQCAQTSYPARCITWSDANTFCRWLGMRLPTEAEWEKAARGTDGRKYPWGNNEPTCALVNMEGCGDEADAVDEHPLGASPYGLTDMAGNMVEFVQDWYSATYYATAPSTDPPGPASGTRHVGRGGGYRSLPHWLRASSRDWYDLTDQGLRLGFRCAE